MNFNDCDCHYCITNAVVLKERLACYNETPQVMSRLDIVSHSRPSKEDVLPLFDFAVTHAYDFVTAIDCRNNYLDDDVGFKIADLIEKSEVLTSVCIYGNLMTVNTMLAIARALQINTSVRVLHIYNNPFCVTPRLVSMLIGALWINPHRPIGSDWRIYGPQADHVTFCKYKKAISEMGHPSLQMLMIVLNRKIAIRKRTSLSTIRRIE